MDCHCPSGNGIGWKQIRMNLKKVESANLLNAPFEGSHSVSRGEALALIGAVHQDCNEPVPRLSVWELHPVGGKISGGWKMDNFVLKTENILCGLKKIPTIPEKTTTTQKNLDKSTQQNIAHIKMSKYINVR